LKAFFYTYKNTETEINHQQHDDWDNLDDDDERERAKVDSRERRRETAVTSE